MIKKLSVGLVVLTFVLGTTGATFGDIITFDGGIATLSDGSTVVTSNTTTYGSIFSTFGVDYYEEDGFIIDFVGGDGIIGNYYDDRSGSTANTNAVIHAHDFSGIDIVFSKADGSSFDLNYVDMTSNTNNGGLAADGTEDSWITTSGGSQKLLPSDWGIDIFFDGSGPSDGIVRNWMTSNFDGITSFTLSSTNAYCFGMDNFYIDEPPPPVPVPGAVLLGILGLSVAGVKLRKFT